MIIIPTPIKGAYLIETNRLQDDRGYFVRMFCNNELKAMNLDFTVAQCNMAHSLKKGTLRGLHYQKEPYPEVKVITCVKGSFFDVIVDIRKNSPTYGKIYHIELSEANGRVLYIPAYVAHGYQTLEDDTISYYTLSAFYVPEAQGALRWDDPSFNIPWPYSLDPIISEKDKSTPDFIW